MRCVVVEGVAVPAAIASLFSDPTKRPFSYTQPLPSPVDDHQSHNKSHLVVPSVLPSLPLQSSKTMPFNNIQYNSPMPIYSREAAEEQYKQQIGTGPAIPLSAPDKHFDPEKSETLKAIHQGEDNTFGEHFFEKIAAAEAPHVPVTNEPSWTLDAKRRSERARSVTPNATFTSPTSMYHGPSYTTLQRVKTRTHDSGKEMAPKRGYEFGGLDFVDKSRIPRDSSYYYEPPHTIKHEEKRLNRGYEMGGTDFTRSGMVAPYGPYHGHGPERPKLHSKYVDTPLKQNELNIETAPNVEKVSPDILVGDTLSNQHISKNEHSREMDTFGTYFGPTPGFKRDHRTVERNIEPPHPPVFSLSAKKHTNGQYGSIDRQRHRYDHFSRKETTTAPSNFFEHTSQTYARKPRSHSEAPLDRYEWNEANNKEVTIETLLNDKALIARKREYTPDWQSRSLEKQNRWKERSDPRLFRPQMYANEPTWSETVRQRRDAWESKARITDERVQLPPSYKVPPQQPPYWYNKASKTHNIWQQEADRQIYAEDGQTTGNYGKDMISNSHQDYNSFTSRTQYVHREKQDGPHYNQFSEHEVPITQTTHRTYSAIPVSIQQQTGTTKSSSQNYSTWKSNESQTITKDRQYQRNSYETSSQRDLNQQPAASHSYDIQRTSNYYRQNQQAFPTKSTSATVISQGAGTHIDRRAEMAEALPRGTIANTEATAEGNYLDADGKHVNYKRELTTSVDPHIERTLLKEEESRIIETPLEPGIISRHITTKYYKKKTVTDTTTTTTNVQ